MSMNEKIPPTMCGKPFTKCKSATFQIDGQTYTIGNEILLESNHHPP